VFHVTVVKILATSSEFAALNEHIDNLLPSSVTPKSANRTEMHPVGRLPVWVRIGNKECNDDLHIYPNVTYTLMSWTTCKRLGILRECYPKPTDPTIAVSSVANFIAAPVAVSLTLDK